MHFLHIDGFGPQFEFNQFELFLQFQTSVGLVDLFLKVVQFPEHILLEEHQLTDSVFLLQHLSS